MSGLQRASAPRRAMARAEGSGRAVATAELERALGRILGEPAGVAVRERRPLAYRSTFPIEEVRLRGARGRGEWLVWKDLSRSGPNDPAWSFKAGFLHDPLREIATYRDLLAPAGLSVPGYRGAVAEPARGRYWLFLERVAGEPLWQAGEPEVWRRAARWLAHLHATFAAHPPAGRRRLLAYDAAHFRRWVDRLPAAAPREPGLAASLERLAAGCREATAWLARQPATLLHGEFYPANVLVESAVRGARIRPVDWEMAGRGPGLLDLAALTSGSWADEPRRDLEEAYRKALPARLRPSPAALRAGLRHCRLLLAAQWLAWAPSWTPPPEHDHDWLGDALALVERRAPATGGCL